MTISVETTPEQEKSEREVLRDRIAEADHGNFLSDEEVELRFQAMFCRQITRDRLD
jgi:hypothetical protein